MKKIVAAEYVSLDGVMENPTWTGPFWDNEDLGSAQFDLLFASDSLLLGRVTYEGFSQAWPTMKDEKGFADRMNSMPKHVATTTLKAQDAKWNASFIKDDVGQAVAKLKEEPGQENILIYGSAQLVNSLMKQGLVDEYRLMIFPVVVGTGKPLFERGIESTSMKLVDSKTTKTGVLIATYALAK